MKGCVKWNLTNMVFLIIHTFKNGKEKTFDMAWEEDWGNVCSRAFYTISGRVTNKPFLGYGNDEDGYKRIVKVIDEESGKRISLKKFGEMVDSYFDYYSC